MTSTAVVTGSTERVGDVARALERKGLKVLRIDQYDDLNKAASRVAPGSIDYCVQLPTDIPPAIETRARSLARLFGRGLINRYAELEVLLPKVAPKGAVVLVTGETMVDLLPGLYPHAPTCLLQLLAGAITTDLAPSDVRVTVASHQRSADEIADLALAVGPRQLELIASYASRAPDMSYDDWRLACLSPTGPEA